MKKNLSKRSRRTSRRLCQGVYPGSGVYAIRGRRAEVRHFIARRRYKFELHSQLLYRLLAQADRELQAMVMLDRGPLTVLFALGPVPVLIAIPPAAIKDAPQVLRSLPGVAAAVAGETLFVSRQWVLGDGQASEDDAGSVEILKKSDRVRIRFRWTTTRVEISEANLVISPP